MINVVVLPGDGIGPQVISEAVKCLDVLSDHRDLGLRASPRMRLRRLLIALPRFKVESSRYWTITRKIRTDKISPPFDDNDNGCPFEKSLRNTSRSLGNVSAWRSGCSAQGTHGSTGPLAPASA